MLFSFEAIGGLGLLLTVAVGFSIGAFVGFLGAAALRLRRSLSLDGVSGMIGFTSGHIMSVMAQDYAIEVNGLIVGWQSGHGWWGIRGWIVKHDLIVSVVISLISIVLARLLSRLFHRTRRTTGGIEGAASLKR